VPAPKVDADQDGYPADADCDDLNRFAIQAPPMCRATASIRTAAARTTAGALSAIVRYDGTYTRKSTKLKKLQVAEGPPGATGDRQLLGQAQGLPEGHDHDDRRKGSVLADQAVPQAPAPRRRDHRGGHGPEHRRARQEAHDPPQPQPPGPDALHDPGRGSAVEVLS
jgi:hypothetical protein